MQEEMKEKVVRERFRDEGWEDEEGNNGDTKKERVKRRLECGKERGGEKRKDSRKREMETRERKRKMSQRKKMERME